MDPELTSSTGRRSTSVATGVSRHTARPPLRQTKGGLGRAALQLFLAFHLLAIGAWVMPGEPSAVRQRLVDLVQPYLAFTGLWQYWDMFAPSPLRLVGDVVAVVRFADGREKVWPLPGPEQVGFGKLRLERWRKWRSAIRVDDNQPVWADAARFVARRHADPENPPVEVDLVRRWTELPPPGDRDHQPRVLPVPAERFRYFRYPVSAQDLAP